MKRESLRTQYLKWKYSNSLFYFVTTLLQSGLYKSALFKTRSLNTYIWFLILWKQDVVTEYCQTSKSNIKVWKLSNGWYDRNILRASVILFVRISSKDRNIQTSVPCKLFAFYPDRLPLKTRKQTIVTCPKITRDTKNVSVFHLE